MTTGALKEVLKYLQEDLDSLNTYKTNQIQENYYKYKTVEVS